MKRVRILATIGLSAALAACGSSTGGDGGGSSAAATSAASAATTYPLTVTQCGRQLTFTSAPKKIVVDGEIYAAPLFDLGAGDRVTTLFSHNSGKIYPVHAVAAEVAARIKALPALTDSADSAYPSKEALVAQQADLVIEAYNGDAAGGDPAGTDALVAGGMNVFTLSPSCPGASLATYFDDVLALGRILDLGAKADALVQGWKQEIATAVKKAADAGAEVPKVFFLDSFDPSGAVYSNTGGFLKDLVTAAGGELVPVNSTPDDIYTVSKEAVVAASPDLVLTYPQSVETSTGDDARLTELWALIPDSPAGKAKAYTLVPYPDGGGTVQIVKLLADAVTAFRAAR